MLFKNMPIRQKLMRVIFLISGMVIFITCITFLTYQFFTSKKNVLEKTSAIGKIISANSTAALAFQSADDAKEILAALKAEPHIIAAALYDKSGNLFSYYPADADKSSFPVKPGAEGYRFTLSNLEGFQPVVEENRTLGSLYLKSDLKRLYNLLRLFVIVIIIVIIVSLLLSYFLSQILQKSISKPILALVETTKAISDKGDYSQRATKLGDDELGVLTDSFNHMLEQIQHRNLMLNEFNQNLEHKIAERTSELETVNKELESFSYSISHDLRAPLRSIIGFTSILEEDFADKLDGEAKRITSVIKSNTLKMGQLIDDLLSFSRMGRQEIKQSNFNTTEMVQQIIEELTANDKGIKWNISSLPDSNGDPNAIRQVWINLISNAIKYSRNNKEPNIEIGSFNDLSLPNQQIFFIKDNGVGFDEKYKNKLFKVFQRLHAADQFEGTGVGLAIVEKVISKHGGKVWTEAEVNKGACFYFSLPLKS